MKRILGLSLITSTILVAAQVGIQEEMIGINITDVKSSEIKSADLAEALSKNLPSIQIVRRSGIANDIILRGAKKDNINILLDDAKIYGACPNRMDPATSHVLTNNIESVEVLEGPYDVENFGTLSGKVTVNTLEPKEEFNGDINLNYGSFNYKKASINLNGGNEKIKLLISASAESSDQYKDGNGNDFYEQQLSNGVPSTSLYSNPNEKAYEKKTLLTKIIGNIDDTSEIKLSYTLNRSDNVLYPNTPMDAKYDDSNIYKVGYTKRDLGEFSKELNIDYYYSDVDHPMDTALRDYTALSATSYMTNHMKSSIWGSKIKNSFEVNEALVTIGLDTSVRNWKGEKYMTTVAGMQMPSIVSLASTDTNNKAIFTKYEKSYGALDVEVGVRYDYTDIDTVDNSKNDKRYEALNGHIFTVYNLNKDTKIFTGLGKSSRVPDARELYYVGSGNENLDQVKNYEVDLGIEQKIGMSKIKIKSFYSILEDYIYNTGTFNNINAKIYGLEVTGLSMLTNNISIDYGTSYLRGTKDADLNGDKDLAEIPPLKGNFGVNYEVSKHNLRAELIASKAWNNYDENADEQKLGGYAVTNLKYVNTQVKNTTITLGVDNLFDKTYASTNTYQDIVYIGVGSTQLVNDPGRYMYVNLKYSF